MFIFGIEERFITKKVDGVVTVNESIANALSKKYGIKKPVIVMNAQPKKFTLEKNQHLFHKKFKLRGDKKIALFQGNISWVRGIRELILSAKFLPRNVVIVLMGNAGGIREELLDLIEKAGLDERVKLMDAVPQKDVASYTASGDVGVIPFLNVCKNYYFATPNKLFEYMGVGLPIAASNFPEMKKIIEEENIGKTFDPENPKETATTIKWILDNQERYNLMKQNALTAAKEKYNWENEEKKLLALYETL